MENLFSIRIARCLLLWVLFFIFSQAVHAQYPPAYDLIADLVEYNETYVELEWEIDNDSVLYFRIERNGVFLDNETTQNYLDNSGLVYPDTYCYEVFAVYSTGTSDPSVPDCVPFYHPNFSIDPDSSEYSIWPDETLVYTTYIYNNGPEVLEYTFPQFEGGPTPGFFIDIDPHSHYVPRYHGWRKLEMKWGSTGYEPGTYYQDVIVETNDPTALTDTIVNIMHVYYPGCITGRVYDSVNLIPLSNARVSAGGWSVTTNLNGEYFLKVDPGSYNINFWHGSAPSVNIIAEVNSGDTISIDTYMHPGNCLNCASPHSLDVSIIDQELGITKVSWEIEEELTYYNYSILKRDGEIIAITYRSDPTVAIDSLPNYGQHQYSVVAFHNKGYTDVVSKDIEWHSSGVYIETDTLFCELIAGTNGPKNFSILNANSTHIEAYCPDFSGGGSPSGFIRNVNPVETIVPAFATQEVYVVFDSELYTPGLYFQELIVESNDVSLPTDTIICKMQVISPGFLTGTIIQQPSYPYDTINFLGARISSGDFSTRTLADGSYHLELSPGEQSILIEKPGNLSETYTIMIYEGDTVLNDTALYAKPEPVSWFNSTLFECPDPNTCIIEYGYPEQTMEFAYDDGTAEEFCVWNNPGSESAIRISPVGYPAVLAGASFYVENEPEPTNEWIGSKFRAIVYDENSSGLPGTPIDSIEVVVNKYGWNEFDYPGTKIDSGDFFLSFLQLSDGPSSAPIGKDNLTPSDNRSYEQQSGLWNVTNGNWMIRGKVICPSDSNVNYYTTARAFDFPPEIGPEFGFIVILNNITENMFWDNSWEALTDAWYAYAVQVNYSNGAASSWEYSNMQHKGYNRHLEFIVTDCFGSPIQGAMITVLGQDVPYSTFIDSTDINGSYDIGCITAGVYDIIVDGAGYQSYNLTKEVWKDDIIEIVLEDIRNVPRNLVIDSLNNTINWNQPLLTALLEDFEGGDFPPENWIAESEGTGWSASANGGSPGFFIPPTGSTYAFVDDNGAGPANNGCCDWLITPELDLRNDDHYVLSFDSYFTGMLGQSASVKYTINGGSTWNDLYEVPMAAGVWEYIEIDLAGLSGVNAFPSIQFGFHANDNGNHATGWAIDNIDIHAGPIQVNAYHVFLDGIFIAETDTIAYDFGPLGYGVEYEACVSALYDCGPSPVSCEDFISGYLHSPENLKAEPVDSNVDLLWAYTPIALQPDLLGFNIYRDSSNIAFVEDTGQINLQYTDTNLMPLCYDYQVSALYDLSPYGNPGNTGESQLTEPEEACLVYGTFLPVFEGFDNGSFGSFWTAGENWEVNGQFGNPYPCSEFSWDPVIINYERMLTSGAINGVYKDSTKQEYLDGQFLLSYDLALEDNSSSGTEFLYVDIWSEGEWTTIAEHNNASYGFDWETFSVDITEMALGQVFYIRFRCAGEESQRIISWFVDNIEIIHYCPPPDNLSWGDAYPNFVELFWNSPPFKSYKLNPVLQIDDEVNYKGVEGYNIFMQYETDPYSLIGFTTDTTYIYELIEYGTYYFYVTALYQSCESGGSNEVWVPYIPWGQEEFVGDGDLLIYPSPANNILRIKSKSNEISSFCLLDLSGRNMTCREGINEKSLELDVSAYEPGVYLLRINIGKESFNRKIVIAK